MNSPASFMYLFIPSNVTPHVLGKVKRCIENVKETAEKALEAHKEDWHLRNLYDKGLLSLVLMKIGEKEIAGGIFAVYRKLQ